PRVSRSSALASKATGFPIAKVAAKLAVGYTLDEITNDITKVTPASFEPTIDYVVTKMPRFTFEKFPGAEAVLSTSMKSVGEAMSIGRNFQESVQKALRSMETGLTGFDEVELPDSKAEILKELARATPDRLIRAAEALRRGLTVEEIHGASKFDPWFLRQIEGIVAAEEEIKAQGLPRDHAGLLRLKKMGFSDARLAKLAGMKAKDVFVLRHQLDVRPVYKRIDTCAAEFASQTSYMYSCYEGTGWTENDWDKAECEANPSDRRKVIILGGGPNRIGQGIEFDYCCVHAAYALREAGIETIMVNCNPETVSTDYDTSDRLYFEPLTAEDVIELARVEQRKGTLLGAIVQFGGQTPLKLAAALEQAEIPILGTSPDAIDLAEDRERFQQLLKKLGLRQPENGTARSLEEAEAIAERIGYPVVIRPSYVLGGRAMEIVHEPQALRRYMRTAVQVSGDNPVLIDSYLEDAIEVDVDALADGTDVHVAGIMEHIEEAGIHSGDSACALPPYSLPLQVIAEIRRESVSLAKGLNVVGLMNVQFAIQRRDIYVLEVNPRASRTVPFVAKATGLPIAKIAARVMAGEKLNAFNLDLSKRPHMAVKEAVFPFARFPGVDIILGPEMKSTGEVMGLDSNFARAFLKAQIGAGQNLPRSGAVFISVKDKDKPAIADATRKLLEMGFDVLATPGTAAYFRNLGFGVRAINKVHQGSPHIVEAMQRGEVKLVFNTVAGAKSIADSFALRRTALMGGIPYFTTVSGILAAVGAIAELSKGELEVAPLQSYFLASNQPAAR
ncbi:MAG TPA: carbamoyl-phosphate synthase large subunit, partial [Dongiaceae bacterium]|nr:carbamoyl-phosphate synthase large subunit [Dongiaceae bacterium]